MGDLIEKAKGCLSANVAIPKVKEASTFIINTAFSSIILTIVIYIVGWVVKCYLTQTIDLAELMKLLDVQVSAVFIIAMITYAFLSVDKNNDGVSDGEYVKEEEKADA